MPSYLVLKTITEHPGCWLVQGQELEHLKQLCSSLCTGEQRFAIYALTPADVTQIALAPPWAIALHEEWQWDPTSRMNRLAKALASEVQRGHSPKQRALILDELIRQLRREFEFIT